MISLVAAVGERNEMGYKNDMPWGRNLPGDLAYFKALTKGHTVVMGRKTYESIGKPLKDRKNVILTHDKNYKAEGCEVIFNKEDILNLAKDKKEEVFIIGGAEIYQLFMPYANKLYLTHVKDTFPADTFFPTYNKSLYEIVSWVEKKADEKNAIDHVFAVYEKKAGL